MKIEKFSHNGEDYEVRIVFDGETVFIKVFKDNKPVNPFRYIASLDTIHDMESYLELNAVRHLIKTAKKDVTSNIQ